MLIINRLAFGSSSASISLHSLYGDHDRLLLISSHQWISLVRSFIPFASSNQQISNCPRFGHHFGLSLFLDYPQEFVVLQNATVRERSVLKFTAVAEPLCIKKRKATDRSQSVCVLRGDKRCDLKRKFVSTLRHHNSFQLRPATTYFRNHQSNTCR